MTIPVKNDFLKDLKLIGLSREVNSESSPCGGGYLVYKYEPDSSIEGSVLTGVIITSPDRTSTVHVPVARLHGRKYTHSAVDALGKKIEETPGEVTALVLLKPDKPIPKPPAYDETDVVTATQRQDKSGTKKKRRKLVES